MMDENIGRPAADSSKVLYTRIDSKLHADLLIISATTGLSLAVVTRALLHKAIYGATHPAWPVVHRAILIQKRSVN